MIVHTKNKGRVYTPFILLLSNRITIFIVNCVLIHLLERDFSDMASMFNHDRSPSSLQLM